MNSRVNSQVAEWYAHESRFFKAKRQASSYPFTFLLPCMGKMRKGSPRMRAYAGYNKDTPCPPLRVNRPGTPEQCPGPHCLFCYAGMHPFFRLAWVHARLPLRSNAHRNAAKNNSAPTTKKTTASTSFTVPTLDSMICATALDDTPKYTAPNTARSGRMNRKL